MVQWGTAEYVLSRGVRTPLDYANDDCQIIVLTIIIALLLTSYMICHCMDYCTQGVLYNWTLEFWLDHGKQVLFQRCESRSSCIPAMLSGVSSGGAWVPSNAPEECYYNLYYCGWFYSCHYYSCIHDIQLCINILIDEETQSYCQLYSCWASQCLLS